MATIAENQATISPVPLPANQAPIASTDRRPERRRVAAWAIARYAIVFAALLYVIAMVAAFLLRGGKELV